MSRLRGLFDRSQPLPDLVVQSMPSSGSWTGGMVWQGAAGSTPTTDQAMRLSAVFACLRLLSEAIATLPIDTFTRRGGIRLPYRPRPAYLSFDPPGIDRIDYLSQIMLSLLTDGNAYVLLVRDPMGVIIDLAVLDPGLVKVVRENGRVDYTVNGIPLVLWNDLLHIKGMTLPGRITGLSPISYAAETIGLGLAVQRFGTSFFDNGALPSAVIESEKDFPKKAVDLFRETWNAQHRGVGNANKVGVLINGAKLNKVSLQPNDSQFLETRQFQVPDVARIFGVPPHLIADASNSTSWGSGLQEQNLAFGQFSLRPWIERIETQHGRLLTVDGLPNVFMKLNLDALLRASLKDRYDAAKVGIEAQFLTINEARALEDLPPVPWGDAPFVPSKVTETGPIEPGVDPALTGGN